MKNLKSNLFAKIWLPALISSITVFYFISFFNIDIAVPDFFYDADTPRTLLYVSEPRSAISSIRPFLFFVSWVSNLFIEFLHPYSAWCILNVICIIIQIICVKYILGKFSIPLRSISFVLTNLSILSWTLVPDTFILGITFFMLSIVLYGDGSVTYRVFLSGIIAASLNIFFVLPWIIAHLYLGKKTLVLSFWKALPPMFAVITMILSTQYLQKFKPPTPNEELQGSIQAIKPLVHFPFSNHSGIFSSVDSMGWFHSPFLGTAKNLLSFFTAPWTQGYNYVPGIPAIYSDLLPLLILLLATLLTFMSFLGLFIMKNQYRVFVSFIFSLEVATCFLFLTYSTHPYLFSPFLCVGRISGLIFVAGRFEKTFFPLVLISGILTVSSLQFMP